MTKKHRLDNGDYSSYENGHMNDLARMDKSPLLANGYNAPPTHLNHIPAFMQMNHHPGNPGHTLMSSGMTPHGIPRPDGSIIKGQNLPPAIEAIARTGMWENCRAAYEDIVKHLERLRDERGDDRTDREQKSRDRDSHSRNGSSNGHSPVLNLSKSNVDQHSVGEHSDRSEVHTPDLSTHGGDRDDDNISDVNDNASEVEMRHVHKDEDISDAEHETATPSLTSNAAIAELENRHSALNFSQLANNSVQNTSDPNCSSTETLLRNIQGLLKVAADNARQQERQISYEKAELKMDVLREREVKDSLERQLSEERKLRGLYQKRCKREKRNACRLKEQLEYEIKKRNQLEEALKASGASSEILRIIAENSNNESRERNVPMSGTDRETRSSSSSGKQKDSLVENNKSEHNNNEPKSTESSSSRSRPSSRDIQPNNSNNGNSNNMGASNNTTGDNKQGNNWNYPGLQDVMASGAFWQNYSESLAQDLERKARQQRENSEETGDSPVKSSLSDRSSYYKNSVLYSSAT
uniref:CSON011449 protein n=1 Tax=Culicoides sonorensis TaxID=179676 RepID=A0A336LKM6_CULSO